MILVTFFIAIVLTLCDAKTYAEYLKQNQLSIKAEEVEFCKGSPILDEEYYYCGFYHGFNPGLFNEGTVFTQLVAINNLN